MRRVKVQRRAPCFSWSSANQAIVWGLDEKREDNPMHPNLA